MSSASALVQSKDLSQGLTLRSSIELILLCTRYTHLLQKNEWLESVTVTHTEPSPCRNEKSVLCKVKSV